MILEKDLIIQLFPHCNLNCDFCYQDKTVRKTKLEYIDLCTKKIQANKFKTASIEMWGGELFYDNSEEYTSAMIRFLEILNPHYLTLHTNLVWNMESNLLFQYMQLKDYNMMIQSSYDPLGRFKNDAQLQLFLRNLNYVINNLLSQNATIEISTVLTSKLLTDTVNGNTDSTLDLLYNNPQVRLVFYLDYNGYKNNEGSLVPAFFEKYPKSQNVLVLGEIRNSPNRWCTCNNSLCLSYENLFEPTRQCMTKEDMQSYKEQWVKSNDCNNCTYNEKCKDMCIGAIVKSGLFNHPCYRRKMHQKFYPINQIG